MSRSIAVFAAWPYANGDLHLGHVAGAYLPADIFSRFHKLKGNSVMMVSGSDSHGTPITLKAKQEGLTPKEVVEKYHERFIQDFLKLGIGFNLFTHTLTENHKNIVQKIFLKLLEEGALEIKETEQFYDPVVNMFLADRYVRGTCPLCKYERARGDECENCGKTFEASEILNPISTLSETVPVLKATEHYFLMMGKFQEKLDEWVSKQSHWRGHVQSLTRAWIQDGLRSRAVTRDIDWGIPVPVSGWESKVIYVWFDAVIGYLSASVEFAEVFGGAEDWKKWWNDLDARSYYFIGKDNIPFHTVIWPIELMAYDTSLNLPYDVPANNFLNIEGEKFSTSRGYAVWLRDMLEKVEPDVLRYYLTTISPETKDSNFSSEEFKAKHNGELVAAWGNLVNRVIGFTCSKLEAKIPNKGELTDSDTALLKKRDEAFKVVSSLFEEVKLRDATKEALAFVREINKYLDETAPWTTIKTDLAKASHSIAVAFDMIRSANILLAPVLPHTADKVEAIFGNTNGLFPKSYSTSVGEGLDKHLVLKTEDLEPEDVFLPRDAVSGTPIEKTTPLFKLIEEANFFTS